MEKPLTVRKDEFVENVLGAAQNSGLPASILLPLLEALRNEFAKLAKQEADDDRKKWQEQLNEIAPEE